MAKLFPDLILDCVDGSDKVTGFGVFSGVEDLRLMRTVKETASVKQWAMRGTHTAGNSDSSVSAAFCASCPLLSVPVFLCRQGREEAEPRFGVLLL